MDIAQCLRSLIMALDETGVKPVFQSIALIFKNPVYLL